MKNIKACNFFILFLCLAQNNFNKPDKKISIFSRANQPSIYLKELHLEKNLSLIKIAILPCLTSVILLQNTENLSQSINQNNIFFLSGSYLLCNLLIDTVIKYNQIKQSIYLFEQAKKISRYMLYAIAIKNLMLQFSKKDPNCAFCEEDFFKTITNQIPLSFHELEQFVFELLHNCIKTMHIMHIKIHTDLEEQIYMLCKEHITIKDIFALYDDDAILYPLLKNVLENPIEHYKDAAFKLNTLIKKQFRYMIKYQLEKKQKIVKIKGKE